MRTQVKARFSGGGYPELDSGSTEGGITRMNPQNRATLPWVLKQGRVLPEGHDSDPAPGSIDSFITSDSRTARTSETREQRYRWQPTAVILQASVPPSGKDRVVEGRKFGITDSEFRVQSSEFGVPKYKLRIGVRGFGVQQPCPGFCPGTVLLGPASSDFRILIFSEVGSRDLKPETRNKFLTKPYNCCNLISVLWKKRGRTGFDGIGKAPECVPRFLDPG
jgi:hypothetical protein